jgi:hypothetical protein
MPDVADLMPPASPRNMIGALAVDENRALLLGPRTSGPTRSSMLIVRVKEVFFHCGKSMIRSGMWEPARWGPIDGLPTYAQALKKARSHARLLQSRLDLHSQRRGRESLRIT